MSTIFSVLSIFLTMKGTIRNMLCILGDSGFGSSSTAEQVTEGIPCCCNLTAIITGATSGIGAETARVLAKRGVKVVIPARNLKKACEMRDKIQSETSKAEIIVMELDLSSFASINRFCCKFLSLGLPLNILINNAGRYCNKLELSEDKFEMTFVTNYLGHYLLTASMLERMAETAKRTGIEGRIINVTSAIHRWVNRKKFHFHDMCRPKHYYGARAYAQSKLANILHTKELAKQLKACNAGVTINSVHPGIIKTGIIRDHKGLLTGFPVPVADVIFFLASKFLKSLSQGAATTCYVALSPQVKGVSGKYFANCNISSSSSLAENENEARKLWKQTDALINKWWYHKYQNKIPKSLVSLCT